MVTLSASAQKPKAASLLAWYDAHRRDLPWRAKPGETVEPYRVWLSEIMLQQTTVATVRPYFEAFLARWPTVDALAGAPPDEVMKAWAGLGYYARARNLHACAQLIASDHGGRFPSTEADLLRLPGVGPYTAAAIAAIAFNAPCVALDGNVERVVTRLFAISTPARLAKAEIKEKARRFLPRARPGDFAQALMDLGATLCTPRAPSCGRCPLAKFCSAFREGAPEAFPTKAPKSPKPKRKGAVFVLRCGDAVLLRQRAPRGLLGGMTAFPATPFTGDFKIVDARAHAPVETSWRALPGAVSHVFTHFALELTVFSGHVAPPAPLLEDCRWAAARELVKEGLPTLMRKVAIHAELLKN
jgi:A/G-specific adenine glycosylase